MQDHIFQSSISPLVTISGHRAVTTSKAVADYFGKRHDNVMRDVENLRKDLPESHLLNFEEMSITVEIGNGATRQSPAYEITRDGFALLCMGFTGKKALAFKLAYIDAFNRMEAELRARPGPIASPAPVANEVERLRETLRLCEEGLRDCAYTARMARQWLTQQTGVGLAAAPAVSALRMIQSHAEGYMLGAEMEFPRPPAAGAPASPLGFLPPEPVSAAMPMQMELISDLAPGLAEAARVFLAAWRAGDVDLPYGPAELRDVQSAFFLWAGQRPGMLPEYLSKVDLERLLASGGVVARKQKVACPGPARFGRAPNVERVVFFPAGSESAPPAGVEKQDWLARWLMSFRAALGRVAASLRGDGRPVAG